LGVRTLPIPTFKGLSKRCVPLLRAASCPAPEIRIRDGEGLSISLAVLPLGRRCAGAAAASLLGTSVQLVIQGQGWLALSFLFVLVVAGLALRRDLLLRGQDAPVRLELTSAGTLWVYCRNGRVDEVHLQPQTLRMGGGFLMVLKGLRTYRLWLARGNVEPGTLAALHRRLGRGTAALPGLR
jgi:hypothetical protein